MLVHFHCAGLSDAIKAVKETVEGFLSVAETDSAFFQMRIHAAFTNVEHRITRIIMQKYATAQLVLFGTNGQIGSLASSFKHDGNKLLHAPFHLGRQAAFQRAIYDAFALGKHSKRFSMVGKQSLKKRCPIQHRLEHMTDAHRLPKRRLYAFTAGNDQNSRDAIFLGKRIGNHIAEHHVAVLPGQLFQSRPSLRLVMNGIVVNMAAQSVA